MGLFKDTTSEDSKDLDALEVTDKPTVSSLHPDIKNANKRVVEINIK